MDAPPGRARVGVRVGARRGLGRLDRGGLPAEPRALHPHPGGRRRRDPEPRPRPDRGREDPELQDRPPRGRLRRALVPLAGDPGRASVPARAPRLGGLRLGADLELQRQPVPGLQRPPALLAGLRRRRPARAQGRSPPVRGGASAPDRPRGLGDAAGPGDALPRPRRHHPRPDHAGRHGGTGALCHGPDGRLRLRPRLALRRRLRGPRRPGRQLHPHRGEERVSCLVPAGGGDGQRHRHRGLPPRPHRAGLEGDLLRRHPSFPRLPGLQPLRPVARPDLHRPRGGGLRQVRSRQAVHRRGHAQVLDPRGRAHRPSGRTLDDRHPRAEGRGQHDRRRVAGREGAGGPARRDLLPQDREGRRAGRGSTASRATPTPTPAATPGSAASRFPASTSRP